MILKNVPLPFYAKLAFVLIGILALGFLIILGKELLDPLIFGFLFAILLLPLANFFERKFKMPRSMSGFVSIFCWWHCILNRYANIQLSQRLAHAQAAGNQIIC
jgi:predicted PurR-regulated permease PerM